MRLVMGLAHPMLRYCDPEAFRKLLLVQDNDYLVSAMDVTVENVAWLRDAVGADRLWLDSGGFTLYRKEEKMGKDNPHFKRACEATRKKFLRLLSLGPFKMCFELDNEYFRRDPDLLSPKNYLREEVKELVGYYPVPVFKMHQGFQYWKDLCDSDLYPILSIGGLAQARKWHVYQEELGKMMNYARDKGKYVHFLGCSNVNTTRWAMPDSVDYQIYRFAVNIIRANENYRKKVKEGLIVPTQEVIDRAGADLSGSLPFHVIGQDVVTFAFADARSRNFLYEKQNDEMID